jgi:hypothetical protein
MKSRRTCYGTRTRQIHIENSYASGQKKRPRGPRSTPTTDLTGNLDTVLPGPLVVDLETQAIVYYLHYHLHTPNDAPNILKGVSDAFLPIWTSKAACPLVELAISSMALAVFSRTQQHPPAAIEASIKYHRLLQIAQVTILSLDEGNIDACLLAIFFMSRYEDAVHRPSSAKTPFTTAVQSFSHHDGALATLKIWKDRLSYSQPATDVIKHTRRSLIKSALMRNLALPEWMREGTSFGERGLEELEYDRIVVRIANVRQRLSTLLKEKKKKTGCPQRTSHELTSTAEQLNQEARDIDNALQDWATHFPSTWRYHRHTLSGLHSWPTRDFYSPIVYSYSSLAYAAVWNKYYATRMLINSTRLRVLNLLSQPPNSDEQQQQQQRSECLFCIKTMANDLASTLPFCLQRFKIADPHRHLITLHTKEDIKPYLATLTTWPLTIASSLRDVDDDDDRQLWFKAQLARLGRVVGIGVLECAETDQWLEL